MLSMLVGVVALLGLGWAPTGLVLGVPWFAHGRVQVPRWWFVSAGVIALVWAFWWTLAAAGAVMMIGRELV